MVEGVDVGTTAPVDFDAVRVQLSDDFVEVGAVLVDEDTERKVLDMEPGPSSTTDSVGKAIVQVVIGTDEVVAAGFVGEDVESDATETGPGPRGSGMDTVDCKGSTVGVNRRVEDETTELACAKVIITVVAKSDADTIFVEMTVFVAGDAVLGATVIVSVVPRLCVTVSITVIVAASDVAAGPPSTGTTEYDGPLGLICSLSWFWELTGKA